MLMTGQWYHAELFRITDELHCSIHSILIAASINPRVQKDRRYEIFLERIPMGRKRSVREISSTFDAAVVVS